MTLHVLASTLHRARQARRLSQRAVAQQSGCTASMICQLEQGQRWPSLPLLLRLAQVLQIQDFNTLLRPGGRRDPAP